MTQVNDLTKAVAQFEQDVSLVAVIELSQSSWLVGALVPGVERAPLKKFDPNEGALLRLLHRWRDEAVKSGRKILRIAVAYEAGRDGFWLARWLRQHDVDVHVIHPTSVTVSREHKRAKTDRLDTALLMRAFIGWLRGEPGHCRMVAVPTLAEEDAKRPSREHETLAGECTRTINRLRAALIRLGIRNFNPVLKSAAGQLEALRNPEGDAIPPNTLREMNNDLARLAFLREQMKATEQARLKRMKEEPANGNNAMVLVLTQVVGMGIETADMLVHEVLARGLRDRRAVARFAGLTGSPDESGAKRRERGLSKAGNARVRRGMIELAWRFLQHQKECELTLWFKARIAVPGARRKKMVVAFARKLLIALWRLAHTGEVPRGVAVRQAT